jgi:hypothetical protein
MLSLAALSIAACRPALRTVAEPALSALVVNNASQFDVNVYALPQRDGKPLWLATIPAATRRSVPITARALARSGEFSVRTQAIGSSSVWTSAATWINSNVFALLDLVTDRAGNCSESRLLTADARDVAAVMF